MLPIDPSVIQQRIDSMVNEQLYLHLEQTTGAYAAHFDSSKHPAATFISNIAIHYSHGKISGGGPFRVGLKMEHGWVYSEGLTHYEESETERLIMAGHDNAGKLVVAMQLSREPF
ncbi:YojF family protein [Paenibacillus sp. LHD-117]|uniref:YojF family protein n=1 Tax=Paenibacillus sp. LHD-117 TaxID=3071412 RepID=UPI0027E05F09|nr:YojF family protein [Paenibacillus sp. LHD-117]MDQ6419617.1 YojF family protein [Paenibacillus sp. LHD-117]